MYLFKFRLLKFKNHNRKQLLIYKDMKKTLKFLVMCAGAGALVWLLGAEASGVLGMVAAAALIFGADKALAKLDPSYPDADRA